jgi:drug/metabolite transporter (DMT)-like permease
LVAGRLVVGSILLWIVVRVLGYSMPRDWTAWRTYGMLGLFGAAVPYTLITWGEQYIDSGLASLLQSTTPFFALLLGFVLPHDERFTLARVGGVILGFAGVGLLMWPDLRAGLDTQRVQESLLGQLAVIGSSVCYAWTAIYARSRLRGQPPLCSAAGQLSVGAVLTLGAAVLTGSSFELDLSARAWASWAGLILFGTVLAYGIYYALIERGGATFATMVTYIIPVNGLVLGALVLGEPLSAVVWISLALILGGVLLVRGQSEDRLSQPEGSAPKGSAPESSEAET